MSDSRSYIAPDYLRSDISRIEALEHNLMALERIVYDLQKDLQDVKKALKDRK